MQASPNFPRGYGYFERGWTSLFGLTPHAGVDGSTTRSARLPCMDRFRRFDEAYYHRYYESPQTRVTSPEEHAPLADLDRKSTRLNSSHSQISYAVFCLKKKKQQK